MSEWTSRPRRIYLAGRRKGTATYCPSCQTWHGTHRAVTPVACQAQPPKERVEAPFIRRQPRGVA